MTALPLCIVCGSVRMCMVAVPAVMYGEGIEETLLCHFKIWTGLLEVIPFHSIGPGQ